MFSATIVVEHLQDCPVPPPGCRVVLMADYAAVTGTGSNRIINLCRGAGYLAPGYYCSLIAEARGQEVMPSAATLANLGERTVRAERLRRLDHALARLLATEGDLGRDLLRSLPLLFGQPADPRWQPFADLAFDLFPCPVLMVDFDPRRRRVRAVRAAPEHLAREQPQAFSAGLENWLKGRARTRPHARPLRRRLAVLFDPDDRFAPSKPAAIDRLHDVGETLGVEVERIRHADLPRLPSFDALFIRETTGVDRPSYRFATAAEALGLPVIDDSRSILRCCNKVYLAETLSRHGIPTPQTIVTDGRDLHRIAARLGYPLVLKRPDGSSSRGVARASGPEELDLAAHPLLHGSYLIVAQEYLYTSFDWRVTVLDGQPLFACRYGMALGHWQIFRHGPDGRTEEGSTDCVPMDAVPPSVIDTAVRAAAVIGNGLYGVDLKQTDRGVMVIEVNDNPNIDVGLEDAVLGDALYQRLLLVFLERMGMRDRPKVPRASGPAWQPVPAADAHHGGGNRRIVHRRHAAVSRQSWM